MSDAGDAAAMYARECSRLRRDNATLRRLLACAYGTTYNDDGELQNSAVQPFIDFKRDAVEAIEAKMVQRLARELTEWARENPEEAAALGVRLPGLKSVPSE